MQSSYTKWSLPSILNEAYPSLTRHLFSAFVEASSNLTLGMERAQSIKDYLINNGLAASRIAIDSKGESQPISKDDAINRRVEVTVE